MLGHLDPLVASLHGRRDWTIAAACVVDVAYAGLAWQITRLHQRRNRPPQPVKAEAGGSPAARNE